VQALKACVAEACAESCAYYAGIGLWPTSVCGAPHDPIPNTTTDDPAPPILEPIEPVEPAERVELRASGGGCACAMGQSLPTGDWQAPLSIALAAIAGRRAWRLNGAKTAQRRDRARPARARG
jgi:hypothetical protein